MPKDDWAKAKRSDIARRGRQAPDTLFAHYRRNRVAKPVAAKTYASDLPITAETRIWFGKHKGTRLGSLPRPYLIFLANMPTNHGYRLAALVRFVRAWLTTPEPAPTPAHT